MCGETNILLNLTNSQEPEPLGAGAGTAWKKISGDGAAWGNAMKYSFFLSHGQSDKKSLKK